MYSAYSSRPVPTRKPQGRSLPAGWHHADVAALCDRLRSLGVDACHVTAWLDDLAARNVRNPRRYIGKLSDADLLADVRNTVAAQALPARAFAGHLDRDRNYQRSPRRHEWAGGA